VSWVYYWRYLLDSTLIKLSVFEAKDLSTLAYSWRLSEPLGARDKVLRKLCTKFFDFINFVGEFLIFLWYFDYFCDFFRRCTIFSSTLLLASEDKNPDRNMVSTGNFVQLYPRSDINWLMKKIRVPFFDDVIKCNGKDFKMTLNIFLFCFLFLTQWAKSLKKQSVGVHFWQYGTV